MSQNVIALHFQSAFKLHQTEYPRVRTLTTADSKLNEEGWVWKALAYIATTSVHKVLADPQLQLNLRTLVDISTDTAWQRCAGVPESQLTLEKGVETIEALDSAVDELPIGYEEKARRASRLRLWLQRALVLFKVPKADRISVLYRGRFVVSRGVPRPLISDLKTSPTAPPAYPLSAMPHDNVKDLIERERKRREDDLEAVLAAAESEIAKWRGNWELLRRHLADVPTPNLTSVVEIVRRQVQHQPPLVVDIDPAELTAIYFKLLSDHQFVSDLPGKALILPGTTKALDHLESILGIGIQRYRLYMHLIRQMPPQRVLMACLLILQAHTTWNVNSVLEMTTDLIESDDRRYVIQGFKSRIGQYTPLVDVSEKDGRAYKALNVVLERHEWMLRVGWIKTGERRLWLNPVSAQNGQSQPYVGWGSDLIRFCREHSLPKFSFEQVRVQALSLTSLSSAGIRGAQEKAGHLSISTTGHYLEQEILNRLRSAMNLEFQRRLEASVRYQFQPDLVTEKGASQAYLLRDIGDGAKCSNPREPPQLEFLSSDGECEAVQCHISGSGCPNRRIHIDIESLEAAVRTDWFFRSNWRRMANENWERFLDLHFERMVFNQTLLQIVGRGPYRSWLKRLTQSSERGIA